MAAAVLSALFLGGTHSAPPASPLISPRNGGLQAGYVAQTFVWDVAPPGATGVRLWIDGAVSAVYGPTMTSATYALVCGVKHRFNVQPYNNAGLAPFKAPPVYVTPSCAGSTKP